MDAREFLRMYWTKKIQLRNIEREIEEAEALAEGTAIDTTKEKVDSSGTSDPAASVAVRTADLKARAAWLKAEALDTMRQIANVIRQVADPQQAQVLHMRYIELKKWTAIADSVFTVERNVYRIHDKGVDSVQEILDVSECQ